MRLLAIGVAAVLTALLPVGGGHSTERERLHVLSEACRISPVDAFISCVGGATARRGCPPLAVAL
jgi:hypothetical protein